MWIKLEEESNSMPGKCLNIKISGRVQGVFFRASTQQQAIELGITGHAINLPDGRVEVLACGEESQLEIFTRWLHQGPDMAQVSQVIINEDSTIAPGFFKIG